MDTAREIVMDHNISHGPSKQKNNTLMVNHYFPSCILHTFIWNQKYSSRQHKYKTELLVDKMLQTIFCLT